MTATIPRTRISTCPTRTSRSWTSRAATGTPSNPWWHERWFDRIKDLIDKYHPDLLYSDGTVPFGQYGLGIIAHLYNSSAALHGGVNQAVYNHKDRNPLVYKVGVLDIERGVQKDAFPYPWQTDTCVGGWFYDVRRRYKSSRQVIEMLVDIVAKNGNLLLNFTQQPDGTLDDECLAILADMAAWNKVNGEGIYGTRPWHIALEGEINAPEGRFREDELDWTADRLSLYLQGQGGLCLPDGLARGRAGADQELFLRQRHGRLPAQAGRRPGRSSCWATRPGVL